MQVRSDMYQLSGIYQVSNWCKIDLAAAVVAVVVVMVVVVCVLDREGSMVVTGRALVVAQTLCLTRNSDCLTGFCEPLLPSYRCYTSLKNVWCDH